MTAINLSQLQSGDRRMLAKAITLIESRRPEHQAEARQLMADLDDKPCAQQPPAVRLGISGAPGVGKSTFIEALGCHLIEQQKKVAVLAVDPSSPLSGGSILGDKTRMERLAQAPNAFIRPSPSLGDLGGVTTTTRSAMRLCEAAGYNVVLVETVGAGQSEFDVANLTDLFLVLLQPSAGDGLQGIKRGILELADFLIINKADGAQRQAAKKTQCDYQQAWQPKMVDGEDTLSVADAVQCCSSLEPESIAALWPVIESHWQTRWQAGSLQRQRGQQAVLWLQRLLAQQLPAQIQQLPVWSQRWEQLAARVDNGEFTPEKAAAEFAQMVLFVLVHTCVESK